MNYFFTSVKINSEITIFPEQFTVEVPYSYTVSVNLSDKPFQAAINAICIAHGISVFHCSQGFVIRTTNEENSVSVLSENAYKKLSVCINERYCTDKEKQNQNLLHVLRTAIECGFTFENRLVIHGSFIVKDGKAVLFLAPSGVGKSTQAKLWEQNLGAEIANGDRPAVFYDRDGLLGERGQVYACGVPWDGKEGIFRQITVPVVAIAEVRQAGSNFVRSLTPQQSMRLLLKQCFIPMWDDEAAEKSMKTISDIAENVSFYRIHCLPNSDAALLFNEIIFNNRRNLLFKAGKDMQIKSGFILRTIVGESIVVPKSENIKKLEGSIILNEIGAFIWKKLEKPISREELLRCILDEFDVSEETALVDLQAFIGGLCELNVLEE